MSLDWVAQQLDRTYGGSLKLQVPRFNPHPAGVMREGGAAMDVLNFLQMHPGRFFTQNQILSGTGRTSKAVDWACIFLRTCGHIECYRNDGRNPRYLRYRAVGADHRQGPI